jgi:HEAT repeat protein
MFRTSRTIAALLKQLVLGTASLTAIVATSTVLIGCEDESTPDYWVKRLEDPAKRAAAVKRLTQFYEDGLTKANQNRDTPEMKALLAKITKPMADAYVKGDLDEKTRAELLKALANTRDPAAKDAVIKALNDFAAGKATADEATQAAGYIKQLKLTEGATALLAAFEKVDPSKKEFGPPYIAVQDAMLAIPDPAWTQKLIDMIGKPVDAKNQDDMKNQIYHQTVAIMILGDLKAANAVKPIFKVLVTPDKGPVGISPVVALAKIGKPATVPLIDIMTGKDTEIVEYSRKVNPGEGGKFRHVATAALVLGNIGRGEALVPMIAALIAAENDETRGVIGREMAGLPSSPDAIKALQAAYEKVAPDSTIPPGDFTRKILAESAGRFMDSSIVPWLLKQVDAMGKVKAEKEVIDAIQIGLLQTAMKLMKADQVDDVKKVIDKEGTEVEKAAFKRASEVVKACGDKVGCYLEKLEDPKVQEQNEQFTGIKAAYMLGMLGNDATKAEIVKRLPKIKAVAVRGTAVLAIDHLSPNGDAKIADELQKVLDDDTKRNPEEGAKLNGVIKQVTPRLRARAS